MSDYDRPATYDAKICTARKSHTCDECGLAIAGGEKYEAVSARYDGEWCRFKTCMPCRDVRIAIIEAQGEEWGHGDVLEIAEQIADHGNALLNARLEQIRAADHRAKPDGRAASGHTRTG